ncbi:MAG TPA: ABC transporter substrate-binding protein [Synergistaceae bacterium]|nr:ABC transporter substrate-binding protein [Synergistaceae bacterium]HPJ24607.1 ABC transporter substrate-binding protein [Synergistaceae bacterium]HPQ36198.1 ABC transporter substrate-binding protein [Synergistaceae bacterium]
MKGLRKMAVMFCGVLALSLLMAFGAFAGETVKIGVLAPLTGFAAADGLSVKNSVELAQKNINAQGGVLGNPIELLIYDDAANPKEAVALTYKLIEQDQVHAVVGGSYSMPSRAVATIFQEEKIPFVAAYAIHPDVTTAGEYCFRNGFLGNVEGKAMAYVADVLLKAEKAVLLYADNDFGQTLSVGIKDYIQEHGKPEILFEKSYAFSEKDYAPYIAQIKEVNPDVIIFSGYYFQTGPFAQQAREAGVTATILGEEGADSPKFFEIAGEAAEGVIIVTNLNREDPRPIVQDYIAEYKEQYGMDPDMVGASAYDALLLLADSMNRAQTLDKEAVQKALSETVNFNGLTGIFKGFTEIGEVVKPVQVQMGKDGVFTYFNVVEDEKIILP